MRAAGEDMWHVYNLVRAGDRVTATTFRKTTRDSGAGSESERVRIKLCIAVEAVEFDPEGAREPGPLLVLLKRRTRSGRGLQSELRSSVNGKHVAH